MGTLKSVCSSWFALISRDIYEHTHLRIPISDKSVDENSMMSMNSYKKYPYFTFEMFRFISKYISFFKITDYVCNWSVRIWIQSGTWRIWGLFPKYWIVCNIEVAEGRSLARRRTSEESLARLFEAGCSAWWGWSSTKSCRPWQQHSVLFLQMAESRKSTHCDLTRKIII